VVEEGENMDHIHDERIAVTQGKQKSGQPVGCPDFESGYRSTFQKLAGR
jgi:hypothetical protein